MLDDVDVVVDVLRRRMNENRGIFYEPLTERQQGYLEGLADALDLVLDYRDGVLEG